MSLTLHRIGRYTSGAPESDTGNIVADASRASVYGPVTGDTWITKGGIVAGKQSGNVVGRMSVYDTDASKNPRTRLGYLATMAINTIMVGGGDGTHYTALMSHSDNGPDDTALMVFDGSYVAIDMLSRNNPMRHSMAAAGSISEPNEQFYNRTAPGDPPPSSYGSYSSSIEGQITAYLEGYYNEAPLAATHSLYPTGAITETTPTFAANFDDLCGAYGASSGLGQDLGDRVSAYRIQVRAQGTTTPLLLDQAYTATSGEKSGDVISRAYGGSALTRGTAYEWRIKMADEFGTYGSYSAWTAFTPQALGFVTLDDVPTGEQLSVTPANFKGRWNHQTAVTMKTVQARILASNGTTVLQTGSVYDIADVASSALPGTLFAIPWANTGFSTLSWGTSYKYQIRGNDGTAWSDWSAARSFNTESAPTVPVLSSPATGAVVTSFPLLTFTMSDADDTSAGTLTGVIRITKPDTSTVDVTPTYNSSTGKWQFQTSVTQLGAFGVYSWKATGFDGTLYSGESTTLAGATWSSSRTFDYETGPTVTVTSPADLAIIATSNLQVAWTAAGQVKYQVVLYEDGTATKAYDSGLITSGNLSHEIPSGFLRNGVSYDLVVSSTNATPLTGSSNIVNIAVAFTAPTSVTNFQATPVSIGLDPFETANRLSWDPTIYAAPDFGSYLIYRSADGGPDAARILLARIATPATTSFIDYTPASGYLYTYEISVTTITGLDTIESATVSATSTITLLGTVLTLMGNGGTYRSCLLNVRERSFDRQIQEAVYQSLAEQKPVTVRSVARRWDASYDGALIDDSKGPYSADSDALAQQRWDEMEALDAQNGTVCIRDGRKRKRFCKLTNLKQNDVKPETYGYSFSAREELASEGTT